MTSNGTTPLGSDLRSLSPAQLSHYMGIAFDEAVAGVLSGDGGPFGAVVIRPTGDGTLYEIVSRTHNKVLASNDPTAHAEITAIREACARLQRFHLSDCVLLTSCFPCPMCMGAALWAQLAHVYYAAMPDDAAQAGFNDAHYYAYVHSNGGCKENKMEEATAVSSAQAAMPCVEMKLARVEVDGYRRPFEAWKEKGETMVLY